MADRTGRAVIEIPATMRDELKLVRITIAAAIQKDLSLAACMGILIELGKEHPNLAAEIAAKKIGG